MEWRLSGTSGRWTPRLVSMAALLDAMKIQKHAEVVDVDDFLASALPEGDFRNRVLPREGQIRALWL